MVHKPTPPSSRTGTPTPPGFGRAPSPNNAAQAQLNRAQPSDAGQETQTTTRLTQPAQTTQPRAPSLTPPVASRVTPPAESQSSSSNGEVPIKTTTSSALRSQRPASSARRSHVIGGQASSGARKIGGKSGLGAKKAEGGLSFEEVERLAKEEADREAAASAAAAQAKIDAAAKRQEDQKKDSSTTGTPSISRPSSVQSKASNSNAPPKQTQNMERLGMAMNRLGMGALKQSGQQATTGSSSKTPSAEEVKYAREKFSNQKAISSDEYFGRGDFDEDSTREARSRLTAFEGAQSISSNQYFGREEEDTEEPGQSDLESQARDLARRFFNTTGEDLSNIREALGYVTMKLFSFISLFFFFFFFFT